MFPLGFYPYLIGGILIGIGVSIIYIATGVHATQSSFFDTTISFFSSMNIGSTCLVPYFLRFHILLKGKSFRHCNRPNSASSHWQVWIVLQISSSEHPRCSACSWACRLTLMDFLTEFMKIQYQETTHKSIYSLITNQDYHFLIILIIKIIGSDLEIQQ